MCVCTKEKQIFQKLYDNSFPSLYISLTQMNAHPCCYMTDIYLGEKWDTNNELWHEICILLFLSSVVDIFFLKKRNIIMIRTLIKCVSSHALKVFIVICVHRKSKSTGDELNLIS